MSNVCVSCGAEIPDECGSMICKRCSDEAYSNDLRLDLIHPKEKDVVIASLDFNKTTVEDAKNMFEYLSQAFPNNCVVVMPNSISVKTMDASCIKGLINNLEELYDSIVNKEE